MTPIPRRREPELMDQPDADPQELERSLDDLRGVNRWLGGTRVALRSLRPLLPRQRRGDTVRVLDVASGSADIPVEVARWARRKGRPLEVVATDLHPGTLEIARRRAADEPAVRVERADALALPYADREFDVAMCHLALHHFDPPQAVQLLHELWRVARRGIAVTDLVRGRLGLVGVGLLAHTVWRDHPITRHDGRVSIRAAYTPPELATLAHAAGLERVRIRTHPLANRMSLVASKEER